MKYLDPDILRVLIKQAKKEIAEINGQIKSLEIKRHVLLKQIEMMENQSGK